ncbi:unnamed protein product [Caenorhabditis bovis]|uniref:SH3 domain-containing protein n=1 Tax=Caenorhabditis bovis TaxID=2654633 RepID=A0A8S1F3C4_9PELO|nr:unnamed protein product [Caenorhabditis bovis]
MLTYSKSWRSIRSRTGSLYARARNRLTSSFRGGTMPEKATGKEEVHTRHDYDAQSSEVWVVASDFDGTANGHLKVSKGDRVEIVEDQATDCADYVQVVLCDNPSKHGLVPASIIIPR